MTVSNTPTDNIPIEKVSKEEVTEMKEFIVDLNDRFLTIKEIAEIFAVRPYAVREWIKSGKLKGVKLDNQWRVQKSVVQAFAQSKYGEMEE